MTRQSPADEASPTAALVIIGNEILSGRTQDANLAYIATGLGAIGVPLREVRVIPDVEATIIETVNTLRALHAYVFTTGGIGPTHDDITAAAIARAFGVALHRHPDAVAALATHYPPGELTETRLKMAEVPVGAALIDNPVSKAPGFRMGNVFVMAGVPAIARAMFDGVKPSLRGGPPVVSRTISCGLAESAVAIDLEAIQRAFPTTEVGSYPYFKRGAFGASFVARGTDRAAVDGAAEAIIDMVRRHGGEPVETVSGGGTS